MSSKTPLVSVLMATHNYASFLPTAVESVLQQEMADLELIIGDNASTDETPEIIHHYAGQDSRIKHYRNAQNEGITDNFNRCFEQTHPGSRYFIYLPADDWWEPHALRRLLEIAEAHPEVAIVHADAYVVDPNGKVMKRFSELFKFQPPAGKHHAVHELFGSCYIAAQAALVRRQHFDRFYPEVLPLAKNLRYASDHHLWLQMMSRGARAYYLPEPLAYICTHDRAHTTVKNIIPRLREHVVILDMLAGACPPELQQVRLEELQGFLASLGFELLQSGQIDEAKVALERADRLRAHRRRDIGLAQSIASLPLPARLRAQAWQLSMAMIGLIKGNGGPRLKRRHASY